MMKKIFAIICVMILLVSIVGVYGQQQQTPAQQPSEMVSDYLEAQAAVLEAMGADVSFDKHGTMIVREDGEITLAIHANADTGVVAGMDEDGNVEVSLDGKQIASFSGGQYDTEAGEFRGEDWTVMHMTNFDAVIRRGEGKAMEWENFDSDGDYERSTWNEQGTQTYWRKEHANGDVTIWEIDEKGELVVSTRTDADGNPFAWSDDRNFYSVNENGDVEVYDRDDWDAEKGEAKEGAKPKETIPREKAKKHKNPAAKKAHDDTEVSIWSQILGVVGAGLALIPKGAAFLMEMSDYSRLSNALFKDERWVRYVEDVDRTFAKYLNVEHYVSEELCGEDFHRIGDYATAAIETPYGLLEFIGHVEGERSAAMPKECPCGPGEECRGGVCYKDDEMQHVYFYKITYGVAAPSDLKLTPEKEPGSRVAITFSLQLIGPEISPYYFVYEGTTTPYFYELDNGATMTAAGETAIIFYSSKLYTGVCIRFGKRPLDTFRGPVDDVCVVIPESAAAYLNWGVSAEMPGVPGVGGVPSAGPGVNPNIY